MTDVAAGAAPGPPARSIVTPPGGGGALLGPGLPGLAARIGARILTAPVRLPGGTVIAVRHRDVAEVLRRDLDFVVAPVNAARIDEVNGPFVLGMDRSDRLTLERHALYAALAEIDLGVLAEDAAARADALIGGASEIDVVGGYARKVAGGTAQRLFGLAGADPATFREVTRSVFAHTFLNLGGNKVVERRAVEASKLMRAWLTDEIARRRAEGVTGGDLMGALLRRRELDDDGVRRTLGGMMVGAVDTTASAVAKIVVMLGRDRRLAAKVAGDAGDPARLLGWCRDVLRLWPHNPVLVRQAAADTTLAGVAVAAGARVFAWTQAAMFDEEAFPDASQIRWDRPASAYLHFGGGLHPCAGRALNDRQIPMLVGKLLERGLKQVRPLAWAGPFPARLPVILGRS